MRLIFIVILWLIPVMVSAQESESTTPTFAPSKTPTAMATENTDNSSEDSNTITPSPRNNDMLLEPFTQNDLSLLVGNVQRPNGIVWFDGELYTACNGDWTLYRINDTSGSTITFVFGIKNANTLLAETTDSGFELWIPDADTGTLWRVDQNRSAPISVNNQLSSPWGISRASEDSFYITNSSTNAVLEVTENGQSSEVLSGLRSPTGIVVDNEYVYVGNAGSARRAIEWFMKDESNPEVFPLISGLQNVTSLVLAEDEFLYVAYSLGTRGIVGRVDPELCRENGGCSIEDVEIVLFSDIPAPIAGMTISDDMRLFLHSRFRPEIYWVQLPIPE